MWPEIYDVNIKKYNNNYEPIAEKVPFEHFSKICIHKHTGNHDGLSRSDCWINSEHGFDRCCKEDCPYYAGQRRTYDLYSMASMAEKFIHDIGLEFGWSTNKTYVCQDGTEIKTCVGAVYDWFEEYKEVLRRRWKEEDQNG